MVIKLCKDIFTFMTDLKIARIYRLLVAYFHGEGCEGRAVIRVTYGACYRHNQITWSLQSRVTNTRILQPHV